MKYDKLVRDNVPNIIRENGDNPRTHTATDEEYWEKLKAKLLEEVQEFLANNNEEELADILEVVYALGEHLNTSPAHLETIRKTKAEERGGFRKKIILEES